MARVSERFFEAPVKCGCVTHVNLQMHNRFASEQLNVSWRMAQGLACSRACATRPRHTRGAVGLPEAHTLPNAPRGGNHTTAVIQTDFCIGEGCNCAERLVGDENQAIGVRNKRGGVVAILFVKLGGAFLLCVLHIGAAVRRHGELRPSLSTLPSESHW
ncbi:telomerase reverse transcriptase [Trypanosoma rangeli]|uniref:Telomerase reverse transcriptase n=1 Tax=Trypanosoma rangeli TaxID=5698 RepID=A0A3R7NIF0_TRYRA|nr:telomerase reverse transcriptase [Trypanosoma rangeli]RNF03105.1 telomerase reverse transcriptase [Trypanosoma rangeli]|eukprot:RNF03105.1 telomerase reverse transcriptase [Trypanosoma rangeli]